MSNLAVFGFEGQEIRFVDSKPVANDVATVLGYADPAKTVSTKVKAKNKGVTKMVTPGGTQSVTVLEEPGIYQLIFGSKLASAEKFQDWVFEEVLPQIRKTGSYNSNISEQVKPDPVPSLPSSVEYAKALTMLDDLPDSRLKRLVEFKMVSELEIENVNQRLLTGANTDQPHFTTASVRAAQLGYTPKEIGDATTLGKYIKKRITPALKDWQGQYEVNHYEVNDDLDQVIHGYFKERKIGQLKLL